MAKNQPLIAARFMTEKVVTFLPDMDITDAIFELTRLEISGAPVVDGEGRLVGILTERDCLEPFLKASYFEEPGGPVADFMSRDVRSIDVETELLEIARLFAGSKFRRFPVTRGGRLVGLISRRDCLKALLGQSFSAKDRAPQEMDSA